MELRSAVVTLFLVMDPLGNVPLFLGVLKTVAPERRRIVLLREVALPELVLVTFLLVDDYLCGYACTNRVDRQRKGRL
jgi:multiple antibiotic resistance protein